MKRSFITHFIIFPPQNIQKHAIHTHIRVRMHISSSVARIRFIKNVYAFSNKRRRWRREAAETVTTMNRTNGRAQSVSLCVFVSLLLSQSMMHTHAQAKASVCVCVWETVLWVEIGNSRFFFSSFGESNKWVFSHIHTRKGICMRVCLIFYRKRKLIRKSTVVETLGSFGRGRKREREGECVIAVHTWRVAVQLAKCC